MIRTSHLNRMLGRTVAAAGLVVGMAAYSSAAPTAPTFPGEAPMDLEEAEVTPRSTSVAFLMGFFPGLFVHGTGHFYAKDPEMGATLLGMEGAGLITFGIGWASWRYGTKYAPYAGSDSRAKKGGSTAMIIGGAIFFLGWIADFAHAPISAANFNREHSLPMHTQIYPGVIDGNLALFASARF